MKIVSFLASIAVAFPLLLSAEEPKVEIVAPDEAKKGSKVAVTVKVTHRGNNIYHFTKSLVVKSNGDEAGSWTFTWDKLPENENFSRTVKVRVDGDTIIEAEALCNKDGGSGAVHRTIKAK